MSLGAAAVPWLSVWSVASEHRPSTLPKPEAAERA